MKKIKIIIFVIVLITSFSASAQSYDEERIILGNFVQRLYTSSPFEGCRIIDDYDSNYLLSVVALDDTKYKTRSALNRMSQVKSQRNAGEFLNGTQSFSEFVIQTPKCQEKGTSKDVSESIEYIKTNSTGYVQQMQLLTSFKDEEGRAVFIYFKELKAK